ncbi:MAG TPA: hypothetical protein VH968_13585 [Gaiellaceae bacterium]|jgi:hypothetical protein
MYARAIEDAEARLRELRREEWEDLGLAGVVLACAVAAAQLRPSVALPLFLGGLGVGFLGVRALWRRWDLLEDLTEERDAYVITEVFDHASREARIERRQTLAAYVRSAAKDPGYRLEASVAAAKDDLEALASELEDPSLDLHPAAAVACARLVSDVSQSPLLNPELPPDQLLAVVRQIRSGFTPVRPGA